MSRRKSPEDDPEGVTSSFLSLRAGLHKFLMRFLVRRQDIEDIVQETFLRAYESERHQKIDFPKSFLFTVAKNIALSEIDRKGTRVTSYLGDLQDLNLAGEQCVEDNVDAQQKLAAVLEVIAALPPQCQRVVVMKKMLGFSHQEIGRRLDISVRTVEKHLAKALQRCQDSRQLERLPPGDVRTSEVRTSEVRTTEVRTTEVRTAEVAKPELAKRRTGEKLLAVRGRRE